MPAGIAFIGEVAGSRLDNAEFFIFTSTNIYYKDIRVLVGLEASRSPQSIDELRSNIEQRCLTHIRD